MSEDSKILDEYLQGFKKIMLNHKNSNNTHHTTNGTDSQYKAEKVGAYWKQAYETKNNTTNLPYEPTAVLESHKKPFIRSLLDIDFST